MVAVDGSAASATFLSKVARRVLTALLVAGMVAVSPVAATPTAAAASTSDQSGHRRDRFLLALGDSISFGFQGPKLTDPPNDAAFDSGYVDVLAARRGLPVTNFSCPGESTATFMTGGCPWRLSGFPVHDRYRGSQLAAALAFLREHRQDAGTITIAIWGNDVGALRSACGGDLTCVVERAPAEIAAFSERLRTILRALRAAAPSANIAVLAAFHAFPPPTPEIDGLYAALNGAIRDAANQSRVQIADARPILNPADDASRLEALCRYTLTCSTNGADGHPSDAGYVEIADAFADVTRCWRSRPGEMDTEERTGTHRWLRGR